MPEKILALDWGAKHVGVAVCTDGIDPQPLTAINYQNEFELMDKLQELVSHYDIQTVLISHNTPLAHLEKLKKALTIANPQLSLITMDEHLTTQQARQHLHQVGMPSRLKQKKDHGVAASLLILDYLQK